MFFTEQPELQRYLSRAGKGFRAGALALGLKKQADAVANLEARIDLLASRTVPEVEFFRAVRALEDSYRALLSAMNDAVATPGAQGSLV